ncbi:MAG: 2-oxoglutarate dehydrogenase, E2 component, dihydrolipoamide succinyltransferase, partial [Chloroflexi bacterium]|nr:2-oxoglutarate dehydrogenase, E2 component, dihydrolipoamide succinyltransferase [Chloroflexota bacterium]
MHAPRTREDAPAEPGLAVETDFAPSARAVAPAELAAELVRLVAPRSRAVAPADPTVAVRIDFAPAALDAAPAEPAVADVTTSPA